MKALLLTLILPWISLVHGTEQVRFGTLDIQMRSESESEPAELVTSILVPVVSFLTDIYRDEYSNFEQVRFTVSNFDIAPDGSGGFLGALSVRGALSFDETKDVKVPTPFHISQVTAQAFNTYDQEFLDDISMISENAFLRDISYALVSVNGAPTSSQVPESTEQQQGAAAMEVWIIALIAGSSTFIFVLCVCITWLCCCSTEEEDTSQGITNMASKGTASASEERSMGGNISPTPSITSQDSSKFTYNPASVRGSYSESEEEQETSHSMNISRWKTPLPTQKDEVSISFGQDISEIQTVKDLSLIEEGTDEESTPQSKDGRALSSLSISAVEGMERGPTGQVPRSLLDQSDDSLLDITSGSTSDVIQELNDLSYQISKLRAGGR